MLEQQAKWAARTQTSHTSVITGNVAGFDGQPVAGACVTAVGPAGSTTVAAAPDGSFRLAGLAAGSYALEYRDCAAPGQYLTRWSGGATAQSTAARYQVGTGQVRQVPVMTLKPTNPAAAIAAYQSSFERTLAANSRTLTAAAAAKTGEITGTVTGKGKPLSGICMLVLPVNQVREYGAKTGKTGAYTVRNVAPGSYHVIFAPFFQCQSRGNWLEQIYKNDNNPSVLFNGGGTVVKVRAGHKITGIDGNLRLGGEISGTVTSKSGATQSGICVNAEGKIGHNQYQFSGAKTSAKGGYQLHALFPGKYTLQFSIGCGSRGNFAPASHSAVKVGLAQDLTVNEVLPTGASISGKVTVGSSSGTALKGICVSAFRTRGPGYGFTSTNVNGDYRVIGLTGGRYHMYFSPGCRNNGNYVSTSLIAQTTAGKPTTHFNAVLQVGGIISGAVTDTHGNPVADMCIELSATGNYTANVPYRTGTGGTYVIDQLSAGTYQVGFVSGCGNSSSYAPNWYDNQSSENTATQITIATGATFTANAMLQPGATITGKVTDASGHGVSKICVDAVTPSEAEFFPPFNEATQTHNGSYTISGLEPGQYIINFACPFGRQRYAGQWYPDAPDAASAEAVSAPAGLTTIDAVLEPQSSISGRVTNRAGRPLSGVCVSAVNTKGTVPALRGSDVVALREVGLGLQSETGGHGTYRIVGLAAGRYHVSFSPCFGGPQQYAEQWYRSQASALTATAVTVRTGKQTSGINGRLVLGGTLSGRVTAAGKPLKGICAEAVDSAKDYVRSAATSKAGVYTMLGVSNGAYEVEFSPCGSQNFITVNAHVTIRAPRLATLDATMHPGGSIAGIVTAGSSSGPPVSASCVEVYAADSAQPVSFGYTGLNGSYLATGLATGSYQVYFGDPQCLYPASGLAPGLAPQWYNGQSTQAGAQTVSVTVGATTGSINAALQPDGEITGTVSAGSPATALSGACVTAFPVAVRPTGRCPWSRSAERAATRWPACLPGQYKVQILSGLRSRRVCHPVVGGRGFPERRHRHLRRPWRERVGNQRHPQQELTA